jgi:hypothetical protein
MKKTIFSLVWLLIATVSSGKAETNNAFDTISVNQTTTHHICQSQSSPSLVFKGEERNTIDTTGEDERALPKSKPKKHVFAKVVLGLTATFIIVFILVASSGNFMRMM